MARYYDMNKLAEMLRAKADTMIAGRQIFYYAAKWLELLPPADVVEVVRCKDCKRRNGFGCPAFVGGMNLDDEDFCSFGEKGE